MPELTERDPAHLSTVFSAWLADQLGPGADPSIVEVNAPASNGFSNETILMTARWAEDGTVADHRLVVRVHPSKHVITRNSIIAVKVQDNSPMRKSNPLVHRPRHTVRR